MERPFERAYTVTDYWDGPREGVADYGGVPHVYRAVFRAVEDDWDEDRYFLSPITSAQAALAVEDWAIWRRFAEYHRGRQAPVPADSSDWGALPGDLPRHRELRRLLVPVLTLDSARCLVARAEFRSLDQPGLPGFSARSLEVRWTPAAREPGDLLLPSPAV